MSVPCVCSFWFHTGPCPQKASQPLVYLWVRLKYSRNRCAPTRNDEIEQLLPETNKQKIEIQAQKFHLKCFYKELGSLGGPCPLMWLTASLTVALRSPGLRSLPGEQPPFLKCGFFSSVWSFCTKQKVFKRLLLGHHLREKEDGQR